MTLKRFWSNSDDQMHYCHSLRSYQSKDNIKMGISVSIHISRQISCIPGDFPVMSISRFVNGVVLGSVKLGLG